MKGFARVVCWGMGGVFFLLIAGGIGGNLFVNTASFQEKLNKGLESNLGLVVGFDSVSYWPWSGVRIQGFSVDVPDRKRGEEERALAEVGEIRVEPDFWSLFSDEIVVKRVAVSGPLLDCLRTREGQLVLPIPRMKTLKVALPTQPVPAPQPAPPSFQNPAVAAVPPPLDALAVPPVQPASTPPTASATSATEPETSAPPQATPTAVVPDPPSTPPSTPPPIAPPKLPYGIFLHQLGKRVGVGTLALEGGGIRLFAEGIKTPLLEISDYALELDLTEEQNATGVATLDSLQVFGFEMGSGFSSPVELRDKGDFLFRDIGGLLLEGQTKGELRIGATQPGLPVAMQWSGREVSVEKFAEALSGLEFPLVPDAGEVDFAFSAHGFADVPETVEAVFEVNARDLDSSSLRSLIPAVRAIGGGRAAVMADLFETDFDATFHLKKGVIAIPHFRARTKHFIVRCNGFSKEGRLFLRARIYATDQGTKFFEEVGARVGGAIDPGFEELANTSWFYREIQIGGTVTDPIGDFLQPGKVIRLREAIAIVREAAEKKGNR